MSQENVEAFKRGLEAGNRGDVDGLLDELHPEIEWHSALHMLMGGQQTVFRGHAGVRRMIGDLYETFAEVHIEVSEVRDLPLAFVTQIRNGKTISTRAYLDREEALAAAGLSE